MQTYTAYLKFKHESGCVITESLAGNGNVQIVRAEDRRYFRRPEKAIPSSTELVEALVVPDEGDTLKFVHYYRLCDEIAIIRDETWTDFPDWQAARYLALHGDSQIVHPEYWQEEAHLYPLHMQDICDVILKLRQTDLEPLFDSDGIMWEREREEVKS